MILKHELLKIFKTPVIIVLLLFFMIVNLFIIMSNFYYKDEMAVLTDLVDQYGHQVDEEMLHQFEDNYKEKVMWMNQIVPVNGKVYDHPSALLSDNSVSLNQELSNHQLRELQEFYVVEQYYRTSKNLDERYQNIQVNNQAEKVIHTYGFHGNAAETVRNQYEKIGERLAEIVENEEHRHLFFMGSLYEMHSFLFKDMGRAIIFELIILVVLITAFMMNYEFEQRTHLITYTSKTGRKLIKNKVVAAIIANMSVMAILIGVTLICYFFVYDYSGLWNVPISSYFNTESNFPYISWWNLSFIEYLGLFVVCIVLAQLLFMILTVVLSIFIKNSYIVFFIFAIILGIGIWMPSIISLDQNMIFAIHFTPFTLILNPHIWFMGNGAFTFFAYYELVTVGVWIVILGIFMSLSTYFFKRQSLQ
ncbi:hypothetical protein SAMN05192534_1355 [Alteribacillus persepolensis]|uniref:ABC-2 family transporter protein n=1 Tax=Alteribacillus persepolensis TaxID=568899 RepID=A0A1G8JNH6_9BACI|nr:hypothetical protein [Alteribacillus persepolensis]SDI32794.1 hypothetical protein SAMN05192534_1355 [Alteribacillus persepolensis]